jgi:hypothetical protein
MPVTAGISEKINISSISLLQGLHRFETFCATIALNTP